MSAEASGSEIELRKACRLAPKLPGSVDLDPSEKRHERSGMCIDIEVRFVTRNIDSLTTGAGVPLIQVVLFNVVIKACERLPGLTSEVMLSSVCLQIKGSAVATGLAAFSANGFARGPTQCQSPSSMALCNENHGSVDCEHQGGQFQHHNDSLDTWY